MAKWTQEEDGFLVREYPTLGPDIPELLQHHTRVAIKMRAGAMGLTMYRSKWPKEDIQILRDRYPTAGPDIPELLTKYSRRSIIGLANRLGLSRSTRKLWTAEEDAILTANYTTMGAAVSDLLPGRTKRATGLRAMQLNLRARDWQSNTWTEEDVGILKRDYSELGTGIHELLKKFTRNAIASKAAKLQLHGRGAWTKEEIAILVANYRTSTSEELVRLIPRHPIGSIRFKARKLQLPNSCRFASNNNPHVQSAYRIAPEYAVVVCATCGQSFIRHVDDLLSFTHTDEGMPVPEGWNIRAYVVGTE